MTTLRGTPAFPFSEMVRDSISAHGFDWAFAYYCGKHGLSPREFALFSGAEFEKVIA